MISDLTSSCIGKIEKKKSNSIRLKLVLLKRFDVNKKRILLRYILDILRSKYM